MDRTSVAENKRQGWLGRRLAAIAGSIASWLSACDMGMSPREAQLFFNHSGLHAGKTMMSESLARIKTDEGT